MMTLVFQNLYYIESIVFCLSPTIVYNNMEQWLSSVSVLLSKNNHSKKLFQNLFYELSYFLRNLLHFEQSWP